MRPLLLLAPFLPIAAFADTVTIPTRTTDVVLYAQSGIETHAFDVSLPAGQHELILRDLPPTLDIQSLLVDAPDLTLMSVRIREDYVPPREVGEKPEVLAARKTVKAAMRALQDVKDAVRTEEIKGDAAQARIRFLAALGQNEGLNQNPSALAQIADLVADQTLAAQSTILASEQSARDARDALEDAQKAVNQAKATLAALLPEPENRPFVSLSVQVNAAVTDAPVKLSYLTDASWQPSYDWHLSSGDSPSLTLKRNAMVWQATGTNWDDVRLTLSTQDLFAGTDASQLYPWRRWIEDPVKARAVTTMRATAADQGAEPVMEAPVFAEEVVSVQTQGLAMTYQFPNLVDVATGADFVWLPFDTLHFDVTLIARATPVSDDTAYVMASFTNTSPEPILPTTFTRRFFDNGLVGSRNSTDAIAPGQDVELGFGEIPGLQLKHTILKRNEGDRGIISKSNEISVDERIEITNLTDRTWPVELRHRVPYSEQEDLVITYTADPRPDVRAVDDKRGILQWNIEMEPGNEGTIEITNTTTWPEGKILR